MDNEQPSFNLSYHFDAELRDVPDDPEEMRAYVLWLRGQLDRPGLALEERLRLLGHAGVYARMLDDLVEAARFLRLALAIAQHLGDRSAYLANSLRFAHVLQWQHSYSQADAIYTGSIVTCRADAQLYEYLDFALQHYGKSLFDQRRYAEAEKAFSEALVLRQVKGDETLIESTRYALEVTRQWLGR